MRSHTECQYELGSCGQDVERYEEGPGADYTGAAADVDSAKLVSRNLDVLLRLWSARKSLVDPADRQEKYG